MQREVEGRRDLEKRLADRKKVRLDYDAYRRKQQNLLQNDAANGQQYEANLEAVEAAWSKCPLGSAPARLLRLLRARPAALGSSVLPE